MDAAVATLGVSDVLWKDHALRCAASFVRNRVTVRRPLFWEEYGYGEVVGNGIVARVVLRQETVE